MIHRLLEFSPDARVSPDLFEASQTPGLMSVVPPGSEREALLAEARADLESRASQLETLATELRQLVAQHDPVQLIPSISVPASTGVIELDAADDHEADDDAVRTFSQDAKIEYLAGLALAGPPGTGDVDATTTRRAVALASSVFDAAIAHLVIHPPPRHATGNLGPALASLLLRAEYVYDRMAGYDVHLEEIGDEVFEPHRALYCTELGFCPGDAIRLVRRYNARLNIEFNGAFAEFARVASEHVDEVAAARSLSRVKSALEAVYLWTPELLARDTEIPVGQVATMLRGMSAEFGCQPEFRTPLDDNRARRYPLIRLSDDKYLAPTFWSVAHGVHDWMQCHIRDNPASRLASLYPRHRSSAAERLVHSSLQRVFGSEAVLSNQHFDSSDAHGEIDCLVAGSIPTVVEAKSRTLTEQGRQGRLRRVETVAQDVVIKSFEQTLRARSYIMAEGGRCFADRQGGRPRRILNDDVTDVVEIVVTLERMDPLATFAGKLAGDSHGRSIWVTNLADLLMVRDILGDPASFLHYARTRGEVFNVGILVLMESDALGVYLEDRLAPLVGEAAACADDRDGVVLGYSSTAINQFFTLSDVDTDQQKPNTGVPPAILQALRDCAADYPRAWTTLAIAVMAAPRDTWRKWQRFVRRHKGEHRFLLPCGTASIVVSPSLASAELREEHTPVLAIPRQRAMIRHAHDVKRARLPRHGG